MPEFTIHLFGPPRIAVAGEPRTVGRRKAVALLAYLAVTRQPHGRDALAALLWPELDQTGARATLRRTLVTLNQASETRWLTTDEDRIALPDQPGLWVDVRRYSDLLAGVAAHRHTNPELCETCVAALTEAAALYSDDFLAGFSLADAPEFDAWQTFQAESLQRSLAGALERLARAHAHAGRRRLDLAIDHARRWLSLDPLHEPAHRLLMQLYAQAGDRAAALQQYDQCVRTLQEELGVPPEVETRALCDEIRAGALVERATTEPATTEPAATERHNLPMPATPFVGRAPELAQIAERLADPDCRLLTVLGPGGIGKTRLAFKAAQTHAAHFRDGAWFVDLAPVVAPDDIAGAIARTLNAPSSPTGQPLQHLISFLRPRQLLLLLDNVEHLLAGVDLLPTLLQAAPQLKLLVTSRERLNLSEEWLLPLEGLEVPPPPAAPVLGAPGAAPEEPDLAAYDATKLFLRCVGRVKPAFQPNRDEVHLIAGICRTLEGMPLGIELAAAWARSLALAEIAAALQRGMDVLASPLRDRPARHRSMRAVFDHSWRLLKPGERNILRQLAIFHNGWTAAAAEAVAGATLADLADLVDKSWLRTRTPGRYDMHELIRQFCMEKLDQEHGVTDGATAAEVRQRYSRYYGVWALEQQEQHIWRPEAAAALRADFANVQSAWEWMVEHEDLALARQLLLGFTAAMDLMGWHRLLLPPLDALAAMLRKRVETDGTEAAAQGRHMGGALRLLAWTLYLRGAFTVVIGQLALARDLIEEALGILAGTEHDPDFDQLHAEATYQLAYLNRLEGHHAPALEQLYALLAEVQTRQISLLPRRQADGNKLFQAQIYTMMGMAERSLGQYAAAEEHIRRSIGLRVEIGEQRNLAWDLRQLAFVRWTVGDYVEARTLIEESRAIDRRFQDRFESAMSDWIVGEIELACDNHAAAQAGFAAAVAAAREIGGYELEMLALLGLGRLALALGDAATSEQHFRQVVQSYTQAGTTYSNSLNGAWTWLGYVALARGELAEARRMFRQALLTPAWDVWYTLEVVAGMAAVYAGEGDAGRAQALLHFVATHPAAAEHTRRRVRQMLADSAGAPVPTAPGEQLTLADLTVQLLGDASA